MDKIAAMDSEEMKASVQELESALNPSILEMLKKRAANKYGTPAPTVKKQLETSTDDLHPTKTKKVTFSESNATFQIPSSHDHDNHAQDQESKEPHPFYFNASGVIVERDEEHSRHLSCADHVAHVDGESYSIPDLLKLTRSVSKELQVKSLTVLHRVVEKALISGYGDQTEQVLQALYKHEIFLHLRVSLDGKMGSAELGLRILALLVLHEPEESSAWEDLYYTRSRQPALSFSVDHAETFKCSALGLHKESPFEMDGSFDSIRKMLKRDIVAGLLVTSITDRFKFFLGLRDLSCETMTHILEILKVMARHSKQSATKIMETSGLADCLLEKLNDPTHGKSLLIFFKSLCVASKGNAEKFAAMGGLERVMRWLTSLNETPETALSWNLLAVVSNYGLFLPVFSDYRPLIYTKAQSLLKFSNDQETIQSRIGFLKTMTVLAALTVSQTEIGGISDELKPFMDLALSLFPWKIDWDSLDGMFRVIVTVRNLNSLQKEYLCIHWPRPPLSLIFSVFMCLSPKFHRSLKSCAAKSS
jgi:ribosomal protein L31